MIRTKFKIHFGSTLSISGINYGSVGYSFDIKFNKSAFKEIIERTDLYKHQKSDYIYNSSTNSYEYISPCGSDKTKIIHRLWTKKIRIFKIIETHYFRGDIESRTVHFLVSCSLSTMVNKNSNAIY